VLLIEHGQRSPYSDYVTCWTVWGSKPGKHKIFFCLCIVQSGSGTHQASYWKGTRAFSGR